jgi:hypothetical protein
LSSTTTGDLTFSNGGFTIGSTGTAPAVDSGASHTFTLAAAQTFTSSYTGAYAITGATGAGATVTLSGATGTIVVDLSATSSGINTINLSGSTVGTETITGWSGVDTITTGNGANSITGLAGADAMTGGTAVDTYIYTGNNQGGAALTITTGGTLAAGDTVSNFNATASDLINVVSPATGVSKTEGTLLNSWNLDTNGVFVNTATTLAGAAATVANVSALIGTVTSAGAAVSGFVAIETNVASGIWDVFQVVTASGAHAAAALATTDTISLVGQYTVAGTFTSADFIV